MDWLDNYLDGLAQYKTTVSPSDTHIWGVKPNLNNQQKRMLFDAAAQSELEYRLIVQEARQAEINAGMGGAYDAGSAARERPATPAAPSGIPVASTASVTVAGFAGGGYSEYNGIYTKQQTGYSFSSDFAYTITITGISYIFVASTSAKLILLPPESSIFVDDGFPTTISASGTWRLGNIFTSNDGEFVTYGLDYDTGNPATNASPNNNYIPTSGWTPSITITAA